MTQTIQQKFSILSNGSKIPAIGVGCGSKWFKEEDTEDTFREPLVEQLVYTLSLPGIVHIDGAECYKTYPEIAKAYAKIQSCAETKKPRSDIWFTDKYSTPTKYSENPVEAIDKQLGKTGLEYVDLYLLHSPFIDKEKYGFDIVGAWKYMETLYKQGKAKNIGVSNFNVEDLSKILESCEVKPVVNQIEFSPFLLNQSPGIYDFCIENGILIEAYSTLRLFLIDHDKEDPFYLYVDELSSKYGKSASQVVLRWAEHKGVLPITTSSNPSRIAEAHYLYADGFALAPEEVEQITLLGSKHEPLRQSWSRFEAYFTGKESNKDK
ncbi:hypothetical protein ACO0QE_004330 [Hanseniaspora vineae]